MSAPEKSCPSCPNTLILEPPRVVFERTLYRRAKVVVLDYGETFPGRVKPFMEHRTFFNGIRWAYHYPKHRTEAAAIESAEEWIAGKEKPYSCKERRARQKAAQAIIQARARHEGSSLPAEAWPALHDIGMGAIAQRSFLKRIRKLSDCWIWLGGLDEAGYGGVSVKVRGGVVRLAHRLAWSLANGPIPHGMKVCHHCDTPVCVNPAHLFLGTNKDNADDMVAKGRSNGARGARNANSKLTEEQVREALTSNERASVLAMRFNVLTNAIHSIRCGRTWKHIARETLTATKGE